MTVVVVSGRQKKFVWISSRNKKLSCSKESTLAQRPIKFLIQGIPEFLLAAVRWPGLEAGHLLSIYNIVPRLKYMVLYFQSSTCHGVVLDKAQGHIFIIVIIQYIK
jgi:hypothetical protein